MASSAYVSLKDECLVASLDIKAGQQLFVDALVLASMKVPASSDTSKCTTHLKFSLSSDQCDLSHKTKMPHIDLQWLSTSRSDTLTNQQATRCGVAYHIALDHSKS
jgi:hypothetical protein